METFDRKRYTSRVLCIARRQGYSEQELQRTLDSPFHVWRSEEGTADIYLGDRVALVVADDGKVVGLSSGDYARELRRQPRPGATRKSKGKRGSLMPTSMAQVLARAKRAKIEIQRDVGHYVLRDSLGRQVTLPKTPSDHRAIPNGVMEIRKVMHIDLRTV